MKEFQITEDFLGFTVTCLFGSIDSLGDHIENNFGGEMAEAVDHVDSSYRGSCILMPTGELLLWMPGFPETPAEIGTLSHEAFHLAKHVLGDIKEIPLTEETEEVYALLVGTIVEKVLKCN